MAMHQHTHHRISMCITIMMQYVKIVARAIDKNSYINHFHVCIKNDAFEDKNHRHYKSEVSRKERL